MTNEYTLGRLIKEVEEALIKTPVLKDGIVKYDFCGMYPKRIDSWRGSYNELALDYNEPDCKYIKVIDFLNLLKSADGAIYNGYKGGYYEMSLDTPIWIDNYGHYTETAITGIISTEYYLIISTGHTEY